MDACKFRREMVYSHKNNVRVQRTSVHMTDGKGA